MSMTKGALREKLKTLPFFSELRYGLEVKDGWLDLLSELGLAVTLQFPEVRADRVKVKFGGLRVSYPSAYHHPELETLIRAAASRAVNTCEECGASPADLVSKRGWGFTLCAGCAK